MDINDIDIIVVGNKRKKILTTDYLKCVNHRVFYTEDYNLPIGFQVNQEFRKYKSATKNVLGAYRCFRGHQDAMISCGKEYALIFEDDAVPNHSEWIDIILSSVDLLSKFDIVSFHGRGFDRLHFSSFDNCGRSFLFKKSGYPKNSSYVLGNPLAYLLGVNTIKKIIDVIYVGNPFDLYIANEFNLCFMAPSPFDHDRQKGSLIESIQFPPSIE